MKDVTALLIITILTSMSCHASGVNKEPDLECEHNIMADIEVWGQYMVAKDLIENNLSGDAALILEEITLNSHIDLNLRPLSHASLGLCYFYLQRDEDAIKQYMRASEIDHNGFLPADFYDHFAMLLLKKDRKKEALEPIKKAILKNDQDRILKFNSYEKYALCSFCCRDDELLQTIYKKTINLFDSELSAEDYYSFAIYFLMLSKYDLAVNISTDATQKFGGRNEKRDSFQNIIDLMALRAEHLEEVNNILQIIQSEAQKYQCE